MATQATDQQMQIYADTRLRVRAEQLRQIEASLRDDMASDDAIFERAANGPPWGDNRTDGPPKLLASQDQLTYNATATLLLKCLDGTATLNDISQLHANYLIFKTACVRPQ